MVAGLGEIKVKRGRKANSMRRKRPEGRVEGLSERWQGTKVREQRVKTEERGPEAGGGN